MCARSYIAVSNLISSAIAKSLSAYLADHVKKYDEETERLERRTDRALKAYFKDQNEAYISALKKKGKGVEDVREIYDAEYWDDVLRETFSPLYDEIILSGGTSAAVSVGASFDVLNQNVLDFKENKLDKIVGINVTTADKIEAALIEGVEAGDSIPLLAIRIQGVFDDASNYRATMIARTEVIGAYNGASLEGYIQSGVVESLQWLSTLDNRTRPEHESAHLQIVKIGEPFTVGGESLAFPGDPNGSPGNIINCRCAIIGVV